jgi:WD40 repeat protein
MSLLPQTTKKCEGAHGDGIWAVAWVQGDLITGSLDGSIKLWDVQQSKESLICKYNSNKRKTGIVSLAAVQDGSVAVACFQNSVICFYDIISKREIEYIEPGISEAWSLCLSPGDDVLASGNSRGVVNIWSMQEGHEKVASLPTHNKKFITSTAFSIDGKLGAGSVDGVASIFDINTQSITQKIEAHGLPIRSIVFSPDGNLLYTVSEDHHANVYDARTGSLVDSFSHAGMVLTLSASTDQRHFVTGCSDGQVYYWDLAMRKCKQQTHAHRDMAWGVAFDPSDPACRKFASVGDDAAIYIYQ